MKKRKATIKSWLVPYELTTRGITVVEAETAEAAEAMVDDGGFDSHAGEERIDWRRAGKARENE